MEPLLRMRESRLQNRATEPLGDGSPDAESAGGCNLMGIPLRTGAALWPNKTCQSQFRFQAELAPAQRAFAALLPFPVLRNRVALWIHFVFKCGAAVVDASEFCRGTLEEKHASITY